MIRGFLRLVRVASFPTAPSDALAGAFLVSSTHGIDSRVFLLPVVSLLLYWGGLILNDLMDLEQDRIDRPGRPIPSGEVSPRFAAAAGCVALSFGGVLAWVVSTPAGIVGTGIIVVVVAYDLVLKRSPFSACLGMGVCRSLNLTLGMAGAAATLAVPGAWRWIIVAAYGLYIASVTLVGRWESKGADPSDVLPAAVTTLALPLGVTLLLPRFWLAIVPAGLLSVLLLRATARLGRGRDPDAVRNWVRTAVLGILLWNSALLIGSGQLVLGLIVAVCIVPSIALSSRFSPA